MATSGKPHTLILYPRKTIRADAIIATSQTPVVLTHLGSSTVSGLGKPIVSANSISAFSVSAIILARSPLIRSIKHTLSISIKYVIETATAETTSAISIKAPNNALLVPFQDRHIEC